MNKKIILLNIVLVIILGSVLTYFNRNFAFDDAYIYYRYIENFINGNGLVYNIGERFNAITSPLYMYISILASSITHEVEVTQTVLNGIFLISSSITIILIFRKLELYNVGFIASLIIISSKYFYQVFGMETNLFIFLSLFSIYLYFNKRFFILSITSALLILTRGEGVFLIMIIMFLIIKEGKNNLKLIHFLPFIVLLGANYLFNYIYYDQIFPHTLSAKIAQGSSGLWRKYSYLVEVDYLLRIFFNGQGFYILFLCISALIGLVKHYNNRIVSIFLAYSFMMILFYTGLNIPNYHWYYSILFVTFYVSVSFGVVKLSSYINFSNWKSIAKSIPIIIVFIYVALTHLEIAQLLQREKPNEHYRFIGEWFKNNTTPDTKIAAVEIGTIGWYSKRYIIDILGLTNPFNAEFVGSKQFDKWFEYYKPDYIIIHEPIWGHEQSIPRLIEQGYYIEYAPFYFKGIKILRSTNKIK